MCTLGSLYLSEVAHFTPCELCWYQRIAMYSLAVILVIAAARRDSGVRLYVTVLAGIGAAISCYHIVVERFPQLESSTCDPNNPCSLKWVDKFGYLTIPGMALTGFVAVIALLAAHHAHEQSVVTTPDTIPPTATSLPFSANETRSLLTNRRPAGPDSLPGV